MSQATADDRSRRLGRAVAFVHLADAGTVRQTTAAQMEALLIAGRAMDFAARLKDFGTKDLTGEVINSFATLAGIGSSSLNAQVLPALQTADVIEYTSKDGSVVSIEEYVGITGTLVEQTYHVLKACQLDEVQWVILHSVEIASWAPLTESQHLHEISRRGYSDEVARRGFQLSVAAGVNQRLHSQELRENVIYNPYVWGNNQVQIAAFLRGLPPAERDALLGICEGASNSPGLSLPQLQSPPEILASARKIGLIQATTVKSAAAGGATQTYVFSPLLENEDDKALTTEALHQRKLFVAHILFGVEKAQPGRGVITHPATLVRSLVGRGRVGPASNIATDYRLLEAQGIVKIEQGQNGRAYLRMVKSEIVRDGLDWLERTGGAGAESNLRPELLRSPVQFVTPEQDRAALSNHSESDEIAQSVVLKLREQLQRAARQDDVF